MLGDDGYERLVAIMAEMIENGVWLEIEPEQMIERAIVQLFEERSRK
jgi:hypothetical protein